ILLFAYTLLSYLSNDVVHGWPSIMGAVLLFGSVQMFFLGIIGEYLGRLYIQSKNRPLYVVRKVRRKDLPANCTPGDGPGTAIADAISSPTIASVKRNRLDPSANQPVDC